MYLIQEMKNIIFLAVLFSDKQLKIYDYNRVIKDLNGLSETEFLEKLKILFIIIKESGQSIRPANKGEFSVYLNENGIVFHVPQETCQRTQLKTWMYLLYRREDFRANSWNSRSKEGRKN